MVSKFRVIVHYILKIILSFPLHFENSEHNLLLLLRLWLRLRLLPRINIRFNLRFYNNILRVAAPESSWWCQVVQPSQYIFHRQSFLWVHFQKTHDQPIEVNGIHANKKEETAKFYRRSKALRTLPSLLNPLYPLPPHSILHGFN